MGLHAGVRKRFKATVVKLRKQFPRIVVKYTATESGGIASVFRWIAFHQPHDADPCTHAPCTLQQQSIKHKRPNRKLNKCK